MADTNVKTSNAQKAAESRPFERVLVTSLTGDNGAVSVVTFDFEPMIRMADGVQEAWRMRRTISGCASLSERDLEAMDDLSLDVLLELLVEGTPPLPVLFPCAASSLCSRRFRQRVFARLSRFDAVLAAAIVAEVDRLDRAWSQHAASEGLCEFAARFRSVALRVDRADELDMLDHFQPCAVILEDEALTPAAAGRVKNVVLRLAGTATSIPDEVTHRLWPRPERLPPAG